MKIENIDGFRILYVMAAKPEYGKELASKITPLFCGVGPVESAISLSMALRARPKSS